MGVQWTLIAAFLYLEIFIAFLFIIPLFSPTWWSKIFKSRLVKKFSSNSTIYFNILLMVLAVLFLDSIREVIKYNKLEDKVVVSHEHSESVILMRLFRAQRNLYVSGFALFMWLVLKRIVVLITSVAHLEAVSTASMKQAESASAAAKNLLNDNSKSSANESLKEKLEQATLQLKNYEKEIDKLETDLETLKKQSEGNNRAYDELLAEHEHLQARLDKIQNKTEGKKTE